jgi:hypothetical protein
MILGGEFFSSAKVKIGIKRATRRDERLEARDLRRVARMYP